MIGTQQCLKELFPDGSCSRICVKWIFLHGQTVGCRANMTSSETNKIDSRTVCLLLISSSESELDADTSTAVESPWFWQKGVEWNSCSSSPWSMQQSAMLYLATSHNMVCLWCHDNDGLFQYISKRTLFSMHNSMDKYSDWGRKWFSAHMRPLSLHYGNACSLVNIRDTSRNCGS